MKDSSLLETLSVFTPAELDNFHRFVCSPFFNDGTYAKDCLALWDCLRPFASSGFEHFDFSPEVIFQKIYPEKTFVKGKIEVVMSKLHGLAKQFAATLASTGFEPPENLRLAVFFRERNLPHRARPILEKLGELQERQPVRDARFWHERFLTNYEAHLLDTFQQNHHDHEHMSEAVRSLYHAHLVQTLNLLDDLFFIRRKSKVNDEFAESLAAFIPTALKIVDLEKEVVLRLLKTGFDFARSPEKYDETALRAFQKDLETNADQLPPQLLSALFLYARNHCTWHFNHGNTSFAAINLNLFKYCFKKGLLFEREKIPAAVFLNMVQAALFARDFRWLGEVMPQCRERITGVPNPVELYNFTLANYHYHLGEHDRALDLLLDRSDDLFNNLMSRKLELKIYYETDSPLLDSRIENFKLFIFRQGKKVLPDSIFQMNNNFIDLLRGMTASATAGNRGRVERFLKKLEETELLAERQWLRGRLEKMLVGKGGGR